MKAKKVPRSNRVASNDELERMFEVCDGGYLRCRSMDALLNTPKAQRQLLAVEKLRRYNYQSSPAAEGSPRGA